MSDDNDVLGTISSFLDLAGMAGDDKSYVLACAWTLQQIPEVESEEQAERYRRDLKAADRTRRLGRGTTHSFYVK